MELSGLQIFKYLPGAKKTEHANCKECGFPTCMAFALKLGQKNTTISKCPHAPEELVDIINAALKVQQYKYKLKNDIEIGGETVMFRHDKTFVSPTLIAITLFSNDKDFDKKLEQIADYALERIGKTFKIGAINLIDNGNALSAIEKGRNPYQLMFHLDEIETEKSEETSATTGVSKSIEEKPITVLLLAGSTLLILFAALISNKIFHKK